MPSDESVDPRLNDYADRYRNHFALTRTGGVLEIRMHTDGGPARFSLSLKHALGRLWREVSADTDNEVIIFTGTGESWMAGVDPESLAAMNSVQQLPFGTGLPASVRRRPGDDPGSGAVGRGTHDRCDQRSRSQERDRADVRHHFVRRARHLLRRQLRRRTCTTRRRHAPCPSGGARASTHRETLRSSAPLTGEQRSIFIQLGPELDQPSTSNAVGSMHRNHSRALGR